MDALIPVTIGGASGSYRVLKTDGRSNFSSGITISVPPDAALAIVTYSADAANGGSGSQYSIWLYKGCSAMLISGDKKAIGGITWDTGSNEITTSINSTVAISVVILGE